MPGTFPGFKLGFSVNYTHFRGLFGVICCQSLNDTEYSSRIGTRFYLGRFQLKIRNDPGLFPVAIAHRIGACLATDLTRTAGGGGIGRLLAHWIVNGTPDADVTGINIDRLHKYQANPEYRRERTIGAEHHRAHAVVVTHAAEHGIGTRSGLDGRRGDGTAELRRPLQRPGARAVEDRDRVSRTREMPRHVVAHDPETDECCLRHVVPRQDALFDGGGRRGRADQMMMSMPASSAPPATGTALLATAR